MKVYLRRKGGGVELTATFRAQVPETEPTRRVKKPADCGGVGFAIPDYRSVLSRFERTDELVTALLDVLPRTIAVR